MAIDQKKAKYFTPQKCSRSEDPTRACAASGSLNEIRWPETLGHDSCLSARLAG
jgi:hypothetical protein